VEAKKNRLFSLYGGAFESIYDLKTGIYGVALITT
jgi:hypothetical protein